MTERNVHSEVSAVGRPRGSRQSRTRRLLAAGAVVVAAVGGPLVASQPASAAVGACYSGIDSGTTNWAWGSCSGVTGSTHWRLHVSCTWGSTQYSNWFYGDGRTDVQCPWPGSVRSTQIDIIY